MGRKDGEGESRRGDISGGGSSSATAGVDTAGSESARGGAAPGNADTDAGGSESARELVRKYFREMQELGEKDVYLSPELRERILAAPAGERGGGSQVERSTAATRDDRRLSAPTAPRDGRPPAHEGSPARSGSPSAARPTYRSRSSTTATASSGERTSSRRRGPGPSAADQAAELPEPEVVEATLAVGGGPATGDMFAQTSVIDKCDSLEEVERLALECEKCELAQGRTKVVFGAGNPNATLMFIGEAPGRDEDHQGIPFVGRAGQLLNKILEAADIPRGNVYIGNIIKCRPPGNRTPLTNEIEACMPYLAKQLACIKPRIICTLGLPATQTLLGLKGSMKSMRGKLYRAGDIVVIPTYHPAAALRDPRYKPSIWEDFLRVKREYDKAEQ